MWSPSRVQQARIKMSEQVLAVKMMRMTLNHRRLKGLLSSGSAVKMMRLEGQRKSRQAELWSMTFSCPHLTGRLLDVVAYT